MIPAGTVNAGRQIPVTPRAGTRSLRTLMLIVTCLALSVSMWSSPARADDGSYKLADYTYGETAHTSYIHWVINIFGGGATPYTLVYSNTSIGYQTSPSPTAGQAFFVHMATANVSVNEPGMFALALNAEASGLRIVSDGSLAPVCRKGPIGAPVAFPCRGPVAGANGTTWADPVSLAPGEQLDFQVPVILDAAGTHAISAACEESQFLNNSYKAQVSVPVAAAAPAPAPAPAPVPAPAPAATPTPAAPPPPAASQPASPTPTVFVKAVSRSGKLFVDIDPNRGRSSWSFRVQKQSRDGSWTAGKPYRTKGNKETRKINLKKGTYRVHVPGAHGYEATTSAAVLLLR